MLFSTSIYWVQGCINRSSLPARLGARRVSSEHVENMELRCAPVLGEPCSGSQRTVFSKYLDGLGAKAAFCGSLQRYESKGIIVYKKASEGEKQAYICWCLNKDIHCIFVEGKSRTVFFPSDTLIYSISRDGSKNYNIRTCEHMILGQLRIGARQTNYAPLSSSYKSVI